MAGDIFHHAKDSDKLEFLLGWHVELPKLFPIPAWLASSLGFPEPYFRLTKFMLMEVLVAGLMVAVFVPLARKARGGVLPQGRLWNFFEMILLFIRDEIARPAIGHHDADRFLPYLWTAFMFILFSNLFGMIPFCSSATGSLSVSVPLALCTFGIVLGAGMQKLGFVGYWKSQVPHIDLPVVLTPLKGLIFVLEVLGTVIRHVVLSIRLFANIFGGHTVVAVLLGFIPAVAGTGLFWLVAPASVLGVVALSLLELLVAVLQAYIFTLLSALFIGTAVHPH